MKYPIPASVVREVIFAILFQRKIPFRRHALRMISGLQPPIKVQGVENIPQNGPCVITVNHYSQPGFSALWLGMGISSQVPRDVRWSMASAWTYPGMPLGRLRNALSHAALTAIARVYGFISMPPISNEEHKTEEGVQALRTLFQTIKQNPETILALAPEGRDMPGGILGVPPPGAGKLAIELAKRDFLFYPVGGYEEDDSFFLSFGEPYRLSIPSAHSKEFSDQEASKQMMTAIARYLPQKLRGIYS